MKKLLFLLPFLLLFSSCDLQETGGSSTYVKSSVDKNGPKQSGYYIVCRKDKWRDVAL
jgi:hypothetical protein